MLWAIIGLSLAPFIVSCLDLSSGANLLENGLMKTSILTASIVLSLMLLILSICYFMNHRDYFFLISISILISAGCIMYTPYFMQAPDVFLFSSLFAGLTLLASLPFILCISLKLPMHKYAPGISIALPILAVVASYGLITLCIRASLEPKMLYQGLIISQPFGLIPLNVALLACFWAYPKFIKTQFTISTFYRTLGLSCIPIIIASIHLCFSSMEAFHADFIAMNLLYMLTLLIGAVGILIEFYLTGRQLINHEDLFREKNRLLAELRDDVQRLEIDVDEAGVELLITSKLKNEFSTISTFHHDIIALLHSSGQFYYINEHGLQLLGLKEEEVNSTSFNDLVKLNCFEEILNNVMSFDAWSGELTLMNQGTHHSFNSDVKVFKIEHKNESFTLGMTAHDMSTLKASQKEANDLKLFSELTPAFQIEIDFSKKINFVNKPCLAQFPTLKSDMSHPLLRPVYSEIDSRLNQLVHQKYILKSEKNQQLFETVEIDGRFYEENINIIYVEQKILIFIRDITEGKQKEQASDLQHHRIRWLYELASEAPLSAHQQIITALRQGLNWFNLEEAVISKFQKTSDSDEGFCKIEYSCAIEASTQSKMTGQKDDLSRTFVSELTNLGPSTFSCIRDDAKPAEANYSDKMIMQLGQRSCISIKIFIQSEMWGILYFMGGADKEFDENDNDIMQLLARWIASIIEREKIRTEGDRFFTISPVIMCLTDLDGKVRRFNPAFKEAFHVDDSENIYFQNLLQCDNPGTLQLSWERIKNGGKILHEELKCYSGEKPFWLSWTAMPFINEGMVYIAANNITETKKSSLDLEEARDSAEKANQAKSSFLTNMSHEIRTPMNGLIGMLDLLKETVPSTRQSYYIEQMQHSSDILLGIIEDILDLSQIEANKFQIREERFNLLDTLEKVFAILSTRAETKKLDMILHYPPHLPEVFESDALRIQQIVMNIAGNAVKFTENGYIKVTVKMNELDKETIKTSIIIEDTGMGIPEDQIDNIFENFIQVDPGSEQGTGLGLSISRQLCQLIGGDIIVDSRIGKGSRFTINLPLKIIKTEKQALRTLESQRLLVVSNDEDLSLMIRSYASSLGAEIMHSTTTIQAMQLIDEYDFDAIVVDDIASGFDSAAMIELIHEEDKFGKIKIICCSEQHEEGNFTIGSPLTPTHICSALTTHLGVETLLQTSRRQSQTVYVNKPNAKVLIVEDNPINQQVLSSQLKNINIHSDLVNDGSECLSILAENDYDLIFMDCQMPKMDGYEATRQIRLLSSETSKIPIIAITASAMKGDRHKCIEAGMDDYLTKPIRKKRLMEIIDKWLLKDTEAVIPSSDDINIDIIQNAHDLGLEEEQYIPLLTNFIKSIDDLLGNIEGALTNEDSVFAQEEVHKLTGVAANLKLHDLFSSCQSLAKHVKKKDNWQSAMDSYQKLLAEIDIIKKYCSELV
ncbi:MAG: response regulator [Lentisphaeria bacterium]|nr:response regulator [Lentisphaeria bacterium]